MKTETINFIINQANFYLRDHPDLRKGQSLYMATYNFLQDFGTIKERENFDTFIPNTTKDCFYHDFRINDFIRTLEEAI